MREVAAVERDRVVGGVLRYRTKPATDGLLPGEAAFLACTFRLADDLGLSRRQCDATELFQRLLDLRNDVGWLAEEYDPPGKTSAGKFLASLQPYCAGQHGS